MGHRDYNNKFERFVLGWEEEVLVDVALLTIFSPSIGLLNISTISGVLSISTRLKLLDTSVLQLSMLTLLFGKEIGGT